MKILPLSLPTAVDVGQTAERRLKDSPYFFLKNLKCEFGGGVLALRGRVPYGQLKQIAEAIVARVDGVEQVVNQVEVVDPMKTPIYTPAARSAG